MNYPQNKYERCPSTQSSFNLWYISVRYVNMALQSANLTQGVEGFCEELRALLLQHPQGMVLICIMDGVSDF